jgi:decaprenyl-phosphate phosphoribosyltransferase
VRQLFRALRPHQWVKNLFVAAPLLFGKALRHPEALLRVALAVGLFCLLSGAVYLVNDLLDLEADRVHPRKRLRPLASGELPVATARAAAALLIVGAVFGLWLLVPGVAACAGGYLVLNLAYSLLLKHVPFVDVLCIAAGFLLRVVAGAYAASVPPSGWLLLCTGLLAAFLGYGKRAHELGSAGDRALAQRAVLGRYPAGLLRIALHGLGAATVVAYVLYTRAPHTLRFFGTGRLVLSAPFVAFGVWRFLWIVAHRPDAESPTAEMLRDRAFLVNLVFWWLAVTAAIYGLPPVANAW